MMEYRPWGMFYSLGGASVSLPPPSPAPAPLAPCESVLVAACVLPDGAARAHRGEPGLSRRTHIPLVCHSTIAQTVEQAYSDTQRYRGCTLEGPLLKTSEFCCYP